MKCPLMELHLGDRPNQQAVTMAVKNESDGKGRQGVGGPCSPSSSLSSPREDHPGLCGHRE